MRGTGCVHALRGGGAQAACYFTGTVGVVRAVDGAAVSWPSNGRRVNRAVLEGAAVVLAKIEISRRVGVFVSPLAATGTAGAPTAVPGLLLLTAVKHTASAIRRLAGMHWDFFFWLD